MSTTKKDPKAAVEAAIAEAQPESADLVRWEFLGETYEADRARMSDLEFILPLQKGNTVAAIEWLIGAAQMRRFFASTKAKSGATTYGDLVDFNDAMGAAAGLGNS